jgi:hypothetical protein
MDACVAARRGLPWPAVACRGLPWRTIAVFLDHASGSEIALARRKP